MKNIGGLSFQEMQDVTLTSPHESQASEQAQQFNDDEWAEKVKKKTKMKMASLFWGRRWYLNLRLGFDKKIEG